MKLSTTTQAIKPSTSSGQVRPLSASARKRLGWRARFELGCTGEIISLQTQAEAAYRHEGRKPALPLGGVPHPWILTAPLITKTVPSPTTPATCPDHLYLCSTSRYSRTIEKLKIVNCKSTAPPHQGLKLVAVASRFRKDSQPCG